jgi:hypothetical protein
MKVIYIKSIVNIVVIAHNAARIVRVFRNLSTCSYVFILRFGFIYILLDLNVSTRLSSIL